VTLLAGVLVASLLGSIHCAGMCGPFTCLYTGPQRGAGWSAHGAYNAGRLISYVLLGAVAGTVGARIDDAGRLAGVAHLAALVAGGLMVAWAAGNIGSRLGVIVPASLAPEWARRTIGGVLVSASRQPATVRALLVGLLTTLLPCGWRFTFVAVAAGTGGALAGAGVMSLFWAGTVPMLLAIGLGAARVFGPLSRRLPMVGATVVLVLGLLTMAGKLRAPASMSHAAAHAHADR